MFEAKNCISQIYFSVYFFQGTFYSMKIYISIYSLKYCICFPSMNYVYVFCYLEYWCFSCQLMLIHYEF